MTPSARRPVVAVVLVLVALMAGCGNGGSDDGAAPGPSSAPAPAPASSRSTPSTPPGTLPASPTVDDLARLAGCEGTRRFDALPAPGPIRGGAATEGAACTVEGVEAHLFVRASEPSAGAVEGVLGGTVENIDRLVGTGAGGCRAWVAVGGTWFALAEERDVLERIAEALGGAVREVLPTGPPASYGPPGCPEG